MNWDGDNADWRELNRQTTRGFFYFAKWVVAVVALVALITIGWVKFVSPTLVDAETQVRRESHAYVETQRAFLLQKLSAIRDMQAEVETATDDRVIATKNAQIKAFTKELIERVELIDEKEVPGSVLDYLEELDQ